MVNGNTSKFIEGFAQVTVDSDLLTANLTQALAYTTSNMAVSDPKTSQISTQSSNGAMPTNSMNTMDSPTRPNVLLNSKISNSSTTPTMNSSMSSMNSTKPTMNSSMAAMNSTKPTMNSSMSSMNSTTPTMKSSMSSMNSTTPTMNSSMAALNSTKPTMKSSMAALNSTTPTTSSKFKNVSNNKNNSSKKNSKSSFKETESFKNKKKSNTYSGDDSNDETDVESDVETDIESDTETDEDNITHKYFKDNEELDLEEGFRGSEFIEHNFFKQILLALLITFMGYILILSSINNLIPISTYAPHLKQFKHLIYGFIFFLITYMCLEVF